ncbi:helix-turn-helix domain-containing protein [Sphingobium fuliginis]|uniref:helix-turn-helix domain-containing protein n=1 Tax=Sphingobium fuliginis (strain ATCC 27551) TaxID=336203 RepID=UPI000C07E866
MTQRQFAARYGLGYPTIRALEQGETKPTPAIRLIVAAIARDPDWMAEVARMTGDQCQCGDLGNIGCCSVEMRKRGQVPKGGSSGTVTRRRARKENIIEGE